ncbi:hypothetical protein DPSP01_012530 [Paraphaeosphaeria sporulosa]|uniref:NF-kappa-B inhibitor-like protein 1 n=1 Tax=Paraphaeosphaeria sporulosa TaxID=1460663 RepID=A0A177BXE9_9PLEO|nr:uncharacterized protein CC84DRAFT_393881 [Paraphaeosphaeria sporulosa]OAF99368.1 hypothetical protein CC84DRAFT_393881 [Paraphaeosphaeria sporulosa]
MEEPASDRAGEKQVYGSAKASRFQFKTSSGRRSKRKHRDVDDQEEPRKRSSSTRCRSDEESDSRRRHRQSKRRHKHRDHGRTFTRTGDYEDPDHRHRESLYDPLNNGSPDVDSDAIFRESIFDAMADDEGADYWEGVYGQPIHIYPNTKPGPDGRLERMTDEEYADFVRTKMWEKSHQHILEERAAREKARQSRKERNRDLEEETAKEEAERENIRRQMEDSLKRGAERKRAKEAGAAWATYTTKWDHLRSLQNPGLHDPPKIIPWPVASGRASLVEAKSIEHFLKSSPNWRDDALALLKMERVRWHPDKMQQRFGQHLDAETLKLVTAVFQVIDRLWNERNLRR